jgi:hypothetical protein
VLARKVFYHFYPTTPTPTLAFFCFSYFSGKVLYFLPWLASDLDPPDLYLLSSWEKGDVLTCVCKHHGKINQDSQHVHHFICQSLLSRKPLKSSFLAILKCVLSFVI